MARIVITISDTTSGEVRVKSKWHPQPKQRDGKVNLTAAQMAAADILTYVKEKQARHVQAQEILDDPTNPRIHVPATTREIVKFPSVRHFEDTPTYAALLDAEEKFQAAFGIPSAIRLGADAAKALKDEIVSQGGEVIHEEPDGQIVVRLKALTKKEG